MPIARRLLLVGAMVMFPVVAHAQSSVNWSIRTAEQLAKDRTVRVYEEPYILAAAGLAIIARCGSELGITPEQEEFIKKRYLAVGKAYLKAFEDAYVRRLQTPSSPALKEDYVRYLKDKQKKAAAQIYEVAEGKRGCKEGRFSTIIRYFDKRHRAEIIGKPYPFVSKLKD